MLGLACWRGNLAYQNCACGRSRCMLAKPETQHNGNLTQRTRKSRTPIQSLKRSAGAHSVSTESPTEHTDPAHQPILSHTYLLRTTDRFTDYKYLNPHRSPRFLMTVSTLSIKNKNTKIPRLQITVKSSLRHRNTAQESFQPQRNTRIASMPWWTLQPRRAHTICGILGGGGGGYHDDDYYNDYDNYSCESRAPDSYRYDSAP